MVENCSSSSSSPSSPITMHATVLEKDLFVYLPQMCMESILFFSLTGSASPTSHLCLVLHRTCKNWKRLSDHAGFWRYVLCANFVGGGSELVDMNHRQLFVARRTMAFKTMVKDAIVVMSEKMNIVELYGTCKKHFNASSTLFILPKLITASLRNLMDGYISVQDSFVLYTSFYGLLMDLVNEYPLLVEEANNLVALAADDIEELQPLGQSSVSLEDFISLLPITDGITWEDIAEKHVRFYYEESGDKKAHMQLLLLQLYMLNAFQPLTNNEWLDHSLSHSMTTSMQKRYEEIMEGCFETLEEPIPFYKDIVLLLRKSIAHILVVTSDKLSQKVYVALLKKLEYSNITLVSNGMEGVEAYDRCNYDVILMEIRMPSVSGWDAARLIREKERNAGSRRTPIIGMTCVLADRDKMEDIDDYMVLPLHKSVLQAIIEHYLMLGAIKQPPPETL